MLFKLALLIITVCLIIYIFLLQHKVKKLQKKLNKHLQKQQSMTISNNKELEERVTYMRKNGHSSVEIIKFVRGETDLGLVQAKKYVDRVLNQ
ncbi:hypothetical protein [Cytobacillus purgationiresistens]|uniref:Ribosomal protein L7/L12 n=1 Tax=Cytobacillus purgationiresistens TaxID=863449 RepID=A0ABU0AQA6_9BACI|nr:hypothetical protein [Cytobacillus purgationiresistens]MDQ0273400.1 ribosomal protein L7/L12 [Cytobacillus purgationiresistens]